MSLQVTGSHSPQRGPVNASVCSWFKFVFCSNALGLEHQGPSTTHPLYFPSESRETKSAERCSVRYSQHTVNMSALSVKILFVASSGLLMKQRSLNRSSKVTITYSTLLSAEPCGVYPSAPRTCFKIEVMRRSFG